MSDIPPLQAIGPIEMQAAHWAVRLEDDNVTEFECQEFRAWVLSNPAHEQAYLNQIALGALADEVVLRPRQTILRLVADKSEPPSLQITSRWRHVALAAGILIAVLAAGWFAVPWRSAPHSYVTGTGELRVVTLQDGSKVALNTKSHVSWIGGANDRRAVLERGEALFKIATDPSRPFRVLADDIEIRVVGTQFNAYRKASGALLVTVLEGNVQVTQRDGHGSVAWSRNLSADQQIDCRPGEQPEIRAVTATKVVEWRDGRLEVEDQLLPDMLAELGRYTDRRLVLKTDPRLTGLHVGGVFNVRDIDAALRLLKSHAPIQVDWDSKAREYTLAYKSLAPESRNSDRDAE